MSFTKEQLELYIQQGEGYNLEFKESYSANIAKEICAFANANGGKILLGVNDHGKVTGINITNRLKSQIQDIGRNMDPSVNIELLNIDDILIVEAPEGANKPYATNGKFYLRYGSNTQQLNREEIRTFFKKEGLILFDEKLNSDFNLSEDFNKDVFLSFLDKAKISPVIGYEKILENLYLIKNGLFKNAGVLLFCKKVDKFIRQSTITCVTYQGKIKYKILDRKEYNEDLYSNYQNAFNYLQAKLNTEFIIKNGPREEKLELPEEALREAILNAIAHRDYFVIGANILLEIFSDRIEITNPGGLVKGLKKKDLGKKSLSRNNLLFGLMQRMGLVEKVGSGIARMRNAIKDYNLTGPMFEINDDWFTIVFKRPLDEMKKRPDRLADRLAERLVERLAENQKRILKIVEKDPYISKIKISKMLKISTTAVDKNIEKLKKKDLLERIGPAKGGYWQVKK